MDEMIRRNMWDIAERMVKDPMARIDPYMAGLYDSMVTMLKQTDDGYIIGIPYNLPWYFAGSMKWHPDDHDREKGHVASCLDNLAYLGNTL